MGIPTYHSKPHENQADARETEAPELTQLSRSSIDKHRETTTHQNPQAPGRTALTDRRFIL